MKGYIELKLTPLQVIEIENTLFEIDEYWEKMEDFIEEWNTPTDEKFLWIFDEDSVKGKYMSIPDDVPNGLIYEQYGDFLYRRKKDWVEDLRKIHKLFINNPRDFTTVSNGETKLKFYYKALVDQDVVDMLDNLGIIGSDL